MGYQVSNSANRIRANRYWSKDDFRNMNRTTLRESISTGLNNLAHILSQRHYTTLQFQKTHRDKEITEDSSFKRQPTT